MYKTWSWSFIIVTDGKNKNSCLEDSIHSIWLDHQRYSVVPIEIVIIGGDHNLTVPSGNGITYKVVPFDETQRAGWITKKKNLGVYHASYNNLCIMHDYYELQEGWFDAWDRFTESVAWDVAVNKIINAANWRHSDWLINPEYMKMFIDANWKQSVVSDIYKINPDGDPKYVCGLPYNVRGLEKIQYVSGGYMCVKRKLMQEIPFNECLAWGQDEDLEWSQAVNLKHTVKLNPNATVRANRPGKWALDVLPLDIAAQVGEFFGQEMIIE